MAAPPTATSNPVEVAEFKSVDYLSMFFFLKQLSLTCNGLSKFYLNWPICKDLLLVIEQLREQLSGISESLGQCQTLLAQSGLVASPLFWLLISLVVGFFGLGCCRVVWNARRDGFFPVDR